MLAASPTPNPSPRKLQHSPLKYGPNLSTYPSYNLSPRTSTAASRRPPRPAIDVTDYPSIASPPFCMGYRNASTQYCPMGETPQIPPSKAKVVEDNRQHFEVEGKIQSPSVINSSDTTTTAITTAPAPQSPKSKRRQSKESSSLSTTNTIGQSCTSKRTRPLRTAPKVLPARYELCNVEDMVVLIADMISELIKTNDSIPLKDVELTRFHSRVPPGISVIDYLQRLAKHATLSPPLLLSMVYYIDRLCALYPAFSVNSLTIHRFLITAATVSAKGLSDSFWNNSTYARVGGIKLAELGLLELDFLYRLDWRIVPDPEVLVDYYRGLVGRTEDYVIEDDVNTAAMTGREIMDGKRDDVPNSDKDFSVHGVTDIRWDEWMRDVADNSTRKNEAGNIS